MFFKSAYAGTVVPIAATDLANRWDNLWNFLIILSVFFFVLVVGGMIYFAIVYRKREENKRGKYLTGHHLLEGIWIAIPTLLLLMIFGWGYSVYHDMKEVPSDAYEIRVLGKQWMWNFQYDNGRTTTSELYVPVNRPVKLIMTSQDVLHGFFIPNFRIKQDVVPGMYTYLWFEARVPGKHQVFCTEYCGTSHSGMLAQLIVLTDEQWDLWNRGQKLGEIPRAIDEDAKTQVTAVDLDHANRASASVVPGLAAQGQALYAKTCATCHSVDGSSQVGPSFKGLYGSHREFTDGSSAQADDNYLRQSIENPQAKVVKGFSSTTMPTFQGVLDETQINALIAYIKSLK